MKFAGTAEGTVTVTALAPAGSAEGRTRDAVARLVHESGPQTAAALAERLQLSAAAIRRHLDALVAEGILAEVQPRASSLRPRGRGRPARAYALTDAGRAGFGHAYDDLASTALRYLRDTGGEAAVTAFAEHRASTLASRIGAQCAGPEFAAADPRDKARLVAAALSAEGYAAKMTPAGQGSQICQHHCPVAHVAAEFPQLCEAETRALAEVLGTNVQRLATIAHGDGVCTTHVPSAVSGGHPAPAHPPTTRSGRQIDDHSS
ncbi:helix-turn-helix transcriptional regulator [Jatrophihabitans sp.]|uniref:helix-turn-helix transcriptional regulator n=1 Tax=Jatrophihabitans sp. TaxID=1932789 RepID=UPI002C7B15B1|nr:helix-turn-helix domain-containing protein [Jatrophihabitans sp.]